MIALVFAIAAPLLIVTAGITTQWVQSERARLRAVTLEAVDNASAQVDRYIAGRIAMLQALATSPAFDTSDYARVDSQARELLDLQGSNIVLRTLDGSQLVNTRLPWGTPLPRGTVVEVDDTVVRTKLPSVSDLYMGTASAGPLIRIVVPVLRHGEVILTLTASLPPQALGELLRSAGIKDPYSGAVADRRGIILARAEQGGDFVGKPLPGFAQAVGEHGQWSGVSPSGIPVEAAYLRSPLSGWLVTTGITASALDTPLHRSLWMFGAVAVALCLLASCSAWRIGRRLVLSQRKIAEAARSLKLGVVAGAPLTGVREADLVGEAIMSASERMREQADAIADANHDLERRVAERTLELQAQTELLQATLDNMDQGLMLIASDGTVPLTNRRALELLELPAEMMAARPAFRDVLAYQLARDDFARSGDQLQEWVAAGGIAAEQRDYERERPNGVVIEVRTVPLPSGGAVRTFADITERRRVERAVRESEERLRLIADHTTDMIVRSDLDSTRRYVSSGSRTLLGYEPQELVGTRPLGSVHPEDREPYREMLESLEAGRQDEAVGQQRYRRRDGSWVWTEATFKLTRDEAGLATGYVASVRDISARKATEQALQASETRLAHALDSGSDGLWDRDLANGVVWYSDRWSTMLGYAPGEIDGVTNSWERILHPDDREGALFALREHLADRTPLYERELRLRAKDGSYVWILARGRVVTRGLDGAPLRIVGTHIDISSRKRAEARIAHMARHDALTDLPNRTLFREHLEASLDRLATHGGQCAVLWLDLDCFKAVNDSLGHLAGDELLRAIATRLREEVPPGCVVARLGGDEFAILLDSQAEASGSEDLAHRLIRSVQEPLVIDGQPVEVGVSIGIAFAPEHGSEPETMFKSADLALYRAKAEGRNTYRVFEAAMDDVAAEQRTLELDLRLALQRDEFEVYYQPLVSFATGEIVGLEALVRWHHPTRGLVSPASFIPVAERTGLIVPLGNWVLRTACRDVQAWPTPVSVAVNVSAAQVRRGDLLQTVLSALVESGLRADRLELEITESVLMDGHDNAIGLLRALHDAGLRIALDDFGTGYSSLSYLRQFPFNKIKIDRSFIMDFDNPETASIVRAIVGLGESLSMLTTAEGIETDAQYAFANNLGCTQAQGYLLGRPAPIAMLLAAGSGAHTQAA